MFNVFFLLPSFWFQATSILMRKKDVEQTKSATIFLDKTIDPWLPYPFHKCTEILLVENEVGQGPMWGRGVDWRWSTWTHALCGDMIVTWNMKDKHVVSKPQGFHKQNGGVRGYLVCWCWIPCVLRWDFRCLCWKPTTKTGTRNSSLGGNGIFDDVYIYN